MSSGAVHVVVGVILNDAGEVLVTRRSSDVHQGGLWEFPGGKVENRESNRTALQREIFEELGLVIRKSRPFIKLHYQYPDKAVVLDVWLIERWSGEPYGKEGQPVNWVPVDKLTGIDFPPANEVIIRALQLPPLYLVCPGPGGDLDQFFADIDACTRAGARLLQLRCQEKLFHEQPEVIDKVRSICFANNTKLLLNSSPSTAVSFGADGVHLNSVRLLQLNERPLGRNYWVSASCHNRTELAHAARINLDFVVLSPVKRTRSHPDAKPIGWEEFSRLAGLSNMPVYALGGMQPRHMRTAWNHGAQGVAMLSGVWGTNNPAGIIRECSI